MLVKPHILHALLFFIWCAFHSQILRAQISTSNGLAKSLSSAESKNSRSLNSLRMLNDSHNGTNRITIPYHVSASAKKVNINILQPHIQQLNSTQQVKQLHQSNNILSPICYTISGRDFLKQDSLVLYSGDPSFTADGNIIVSGQYADYTTGKLVSGGFCMKTDVMGNIIWSRLYDSAVHVGFDYMYYAKSIELHDGSILLAGRTTNQISGNDDFVLVKLDNNGNIIWLKTYASRFWQGFNGSGDAFGLRTLKEDPATGEIYFVGFHWTGYSTITKVDPSDGHIIWSNAYQTWDQDITFGMVINAGNLMLFQLEDGYYNESYIDVTAIDKTSGDTLYSKHITQTGDLSAPRLFSTYDVVKQNNGHYLLSGPTTGSTEFPVYTGTIDIYQAGIIELDENLDFVKAFGFKNRIQSNIENTRISLFPDGSGMFTMITDGGGYNGDEYVSLFNNDQIYHERKRIHLNEGIPYEPASLQLPDGGFADIKLLGDSTLPITGGSKIDFYRIHTSDTASACLGVKDSSTSLWYFNFQPMIKPLQSIQKNVFSESRVKTLQSQNFSTVLEPACQIISHCDSLKMEISDSVICNGSSVNIIVHKNQECGSLVPLLYDTNWVSKVSKLNDSTSVLVFNKPGKGYIQASLMGCSLKTDSVFLNVLTARDSLNLGPDTIICPGNQITLNAGTGFQSYKWQDGSTDSIFVINQAGIYYLTAVSSCKATFTDTVKVENHPQVPIDIGPDRAKCNNDTLQLAAPSGFLNYTWGNNYNISSLTSQTVIINPSIDTSYYIKAEKIKGCFAYDTVYITVNHSPVIDLGPDQRFCKGDSTILDAGSGFASYIWNNNSTSRTITINSVGAYSVIATTQQGCKSYDTLQVAQLYALPLVSIDKTASLCAGESRTLNPGVFAAYQWQDGSNGKSFTVSDTGRYYVTVTNNNGCKGSDTTIISIINPLPKNFLPNDTSICTYGKIVLQPFSSYESSSWSTGETSASITITNAGVYWLQVTDTNNCQGRDSTIVSQKDCMKGIFVPSAFTPNKDGKNDQFRPLLFGNVKQYRFIVYNRWGQIVFQSSELGKGWDGTINGNLQSTNVFVWMCNYQFEGEELKTEKGTVILLR